MLGIEKGVFIKSRGASGAASADTVPGAGAPSVVGSTAAHVPARRHAFVYTDALSLSHYGKRSRFDNFN